ncbi:MAG: hypothetical protein E7046_04820 [Lentisphaerae bacterium]|nr:hypothetical protein [Lentisphaerota bacterium]
MNRVMLVVSITAMSVVTPFAAAVGGERCAAHPQADSKEGRSALGAAAAIAAPVYETDGVRVDPEGITCREQGEPVAEFPVGADDWRSECYGRTLSIESGKYFNGLKCLYVGGATSKCDTAWNAMSKRVKLPKGLKNCQVEMRVYSDKMLSTTLRPILGKHEKWQNAVFWYDAAGKEIALGGFPYYVAGGGRFSDVKVPLTVPDGAAGMALRLGFDHPNVDPGEKVAFARIVLASVGPVKRFVKEASFVSEVHRRGGVSWVAKTPPGTSVKFQWRGAAKAKDLFSAKFNGPDGTDASFYTRPFQANAPFVQYRAVLVSDGASTPVLKKVTVGGVADGRWTDIVDDQPPEIWRAMPSPTTDAKVRLAFSIRDRSAVDWDSVKVRVDGKDVTADFVREGDVLHEKVQRTEPFTKGVHWAEIDASDCRGFSVTAKKLFYIGEVPKGMPSYTLRDDGMTLVDGKPFFPIGLYGLCEREFNGNNFDKAFADVKAAGFNFAQTYGRSYAREFLDAAQKHDVKLWVQWRNPDANFMNKGRVFPQVLAWYLGDDTSEHATPQEVRDRHDAVTSIDPNRLTCQADGVGTGNRISNYARYVTGTDVFMPEIYPVCRKKGDISDKTCVADVVRTMKTIKRDAMEYGDGRVRGFWPILQWFKGWSVWDHFPSREQLFATSFAAIIHGGHGITWYTYGGGYDKKRKKYNEGVTSTPERWKAICDLATWLKELTPALVARTGRQPPPAEILSGAKFDPLGQPSVTALLKRCDGAVFLLTVNAAPESVRVRFRLEGVADKAEVMKESRFVSCPGGVLEDDFKPFGVHVYRIEEND